MGQLGKGAFGTVYEARLHSQGADSYTSPLAIKALSKTLIRTKGLAARVRNEVTIHYQLRHSNVLELVHFFEDDTSVYLVLEYAAGGELYRKVRAGSLSLAQIRSIFAAIVEGLAYLHSHGIIHRDLKLSNILLATDLTPVRRPKAKGTSAPFNLIICCVENCRFWPSCQSGGGSSRWRTANPLWNPKLLGSV